MKKFYSQGGKYPPMHILMMGPTMYLYNNVNIPTKLFTNCRTVPTSHRQLDLDFLKLYFFFFSAYFSNGIGPIMVNCVTRKKKI